MAFGDEPHDVDLVVATGESVLDGCYLDGEWFSDSLLGESLDEF